MLRRDKFPGRGVVLDQGLRPHVLPAGSAAAAAVIQIGRPFAVRCAVQVHLSHNVPGFHFVRAVRVMRTAVLGPGTANDTGEMTPSPPNDQTNSSSNNKRPRTAQLLDNAPEY